MGDTPVRQPRGSLPAWLDGIVGRATSSTVQRVLERYASAGGGLLANGLAYSALFAIVPAIVLALGAATLLLGPGADRAAFVDAAGRAVPPLRDLLDPILTELDRLSGSITILGIAGFVWGASRFTIALERAFELIFGGRAHRGALRRQALALASVGLLALAVVALALLAGAATIVEGLYAGPAGGLMSPIAGIAFGVSGPIGGVIGLAAVYRYVPPSRPTWWDVLPPAIVVGAALAVATRTFAIIAPRLVGAAAVFGSLATAFIALAWFGATFQALLLGAAWVSVRAERRQSRAADQPSP